MMRVLLAVALAACVPAHAAGIFVGSGSRAGGSSAAPDPVMGFRPYSNSSFDNITSDAFGMTTVIDCNAETLVAANFPCTVGGTFTEAGGDVTPGFAAPLTDVDARAGDYDRFYSHRAPSTSLGEVASGTDVRLSVLAFLTDRAAVQYVAGKYDSTNSQGYAIRVTAAGVVEGVINATTFGSYQLDSFGEWNWIVLVCSSDTCSLYVNGFVAGSTGARSGTLATVTSAKNFEFGCRSNAVNTNCIDGKIARVLVETCSSCIVTSSVAATEQKRAQQLMGVWPAFSAITSAVLTTDIRATRAMLDIDRDCDGTVRLFRMGSKWLRVGRRKMGAEGQQSQACVTGYLPEPAATNLALRNTDMTTTWTKLNAGDTVTADIFFSPFSAQATSNADGDRLTADNATADHGVRQSMTLTAAPHQWSMGFAYDATAGDKPIGWLRDNTIGSTATAWFDLRTCTPLTQGAGLHYDSNGFGRYAAARAFSLGYISTVHWCYATITVDGTAASHNMDAGWSTADGVTSIAGGSARMGGLWGPQMVALDDGYPSTSIILTAGSTVARGFDGLRVAGGANIPRQGQLGWSILLRDSKMTNGSTGNVASHICDPYLDANNYILLKVTASTGSGLRGTSQTRVDGAGGIFTSILSGGTALLDCCSNSPPGQWYGPSNNPNSGARYRARLVYQDNDMRSYVNGDTSPGTIDTSGTMPDLSAGYIAIGYEPATGTNQPAGLIEYCDIYDREYEPTFR